MKGVLRKIYVFLTKVLFFSVVIGLSLETRRKNRECLLRGKGDGLGGSTCIGKSTKREGCSKLWSQVSCDVTHGHSYLYCQKQACRGIFSQQLWWIAPLGFHHNWKRHWLLLSEDCILTCPLLQKIAILEINMVRWLISGCIRIWLSGMSSAPHEKYTGRER